MMIRIGDNSKINNSNIVDGNDNTMSEKHNSSVIKTVIITIVATVIAGVILIAIEYYFNVLGVFQNG